MQLLFAAAALVATTSALGPSKAQPRNLELGTAKIVNRCSYPVYLWSVFKELGCDKAVATELKTGEVYSEKFRVPESDHTGGISIKLSKYDTCGGKDITQLEYKIDTSEKYKGNFLDMSFVDCTGNLEDCPGRTDGFFMKSGNKGGVFKSAVNNEHCPVFNVYNTEEAAKVSYIKWDDRQTKFCDMSADLDLYLCGGDAPDSDDGSSDIPVSSAAPSPSSSEIESSSSAAPSTTSKKEKPTSSTPTPSSSSAEEEFVVAAAAVTPPPAAPVVKTEVVYVTEYVDRRHVHAHGRRHQHFHA